MKLHPNLIELFNNKIQNGTLKLLYEEYKTKYVYIKELELYKGILDINKCNIEKYKSLCKDKSLEINGFTITLVWQSGDHEVFNTWINKGHKGYGDSIINLNWGIESFLNIDNQGNDIILKDKYKISQYKSPRLKYWK